MVAALFVALKGRPDLDQVHCMEAATEFVKPTYALITVGSSSSAISLATLNISSGVA